ncbi:hypothetical protein MSWHS_1786 [Methanosarcina sp. WWM596]|nr:hypothetical protein MSWHS_1786 [Methanosarcina sp. WWM596]AKB21792.1 hypothetical protein MSWH1_1521 [Methanosarcina sp. WH1]
MTGFTSTSVRADAGAGKAAEKISSVVNKTRTENNLKFGVLNIIVNYFTHTQYKEFTFSKKILLAKFAALSVLLHQFYKT